MIVTTSQNKHPKAVMRAEQIAKELNLPLVPRADQSIEALQEQYGNEFLVATSKDTKWFRKRNEQPLFFHPGMSVVRIKRLLSGDNDIMIKICQLQPGDSFLDCTLGLAADAIVAAFVVGDQGRVVGIESEQMLAYLVKRGLLELNSNPYVQEAARRVEVWSGAHLDWLKQLPDRSFDVVYFDPMFRKGVKESSSLKNLRSFANSLPICKDAIFEAARIAKKRVVLKENKNSGEFERLGFTPIRRENMDVTYGVIEI